MGIVLVTGGAGYIGSAVTELLLAGGHKPVVVDNLTQGHRAAVPPGVSLVVADLQDRAALERIFTEFPVDAVIHLAAVSVVGDSVREPLRYYRENVGGFLNLLEAMRAAEVRRIVFSSTASVYGIPEQVPITESCAARPINPYGWSKLLGEQILADARAAHGPACVSLRYFNVAGATEICGEAHEPETHLIPRVLEVAAGRRPHLELYGTDYDTPDGTCIRDYIHVTDLAEAHVRALDAVRLGAPAAGDDSENAGAARHGGPRRAPTIYNLGNNRGYSVREVIERARRVTRRKIPVVDFPRRAGDPPVLVASHEKIRAELGWTPRRGLEEMIASAWEWRQRHADGYPE